MSKPLIGVILGAVLGAIDGLTAWFTPAVRNQLAGIVFGSTIKGIIAGVAIGDGSGSGRVATTGASRITRSSSPWGQVLGEPIPSHFRQKKECSNINGVMPSSPGSNSSKIFGAS